MTQGAYEKKIAIVQSNYIPWKGYFDLISQVDEFVLYDDTQFTKRDWRNRNLIKTQHGLKWLTIPIETHGKLEQNICETRILDRRWAKKHWQSLLTNYASTPGFKLTLVFIPEQNAGYWNGWDPCKMIPFLVPSLTGIAMLGGFSPSVCSDYTNFGFGSYDVTAISHSLQNWDDKTLCHEAVSLEFNKIIVLDPVEREVKQWEIDCGKFKFPDTKSVTATNVYRQP